jgi:formylglycine-generating enzyme required for sulfatase activity
MGADVDATCAYGEDYPQHKITLTHPFLMKQTEVTQAEWKTLMNSEPSANKGCPSCPVETITWFEAVDYCNKLSQQAGLEVCYDVQAGPTVLWSKGYSCKGYRLPTSAEWEYAYRAGNQTELYSGQSIGNCACGPGTALDPIAWSCGNATKPQPVGTKLPNAWGLYDMAGNVFEDVWDWIPIPNYKPSPEPQADPTGPSDGLQKEIRGGAANVSSIRDCASYRRQNSIPTVGSPSLGFRPVRTLK